ncbi:hypothetical protein T06_15455 [Trichinella sp. T6]|nr:hypothetical protein T06_15455 [Trichinella sp. T6]
MDRIKIQNPKADIVPEFQGKIRLMESCTPQNNSLICQTRMGCMSNGWNTKIPMPTVCEPVVRRF